MRKVCLTLNHVGNNGRKYPIAARREGYARTRRPPCKPACSVPADVQERDHRVNLPYVDIRGLTMTLYCHYVLLLCCYSPAPVATPVFNRFSRTIATKQRKWRGDQPVATRADQHARSSIDGVLSRVLIESRSNPQKLAISPGFLAICRSSSA
jgi:hypothetical protein